MKNEQIGAKRVGLRPKNCRMKGERVRAEVQIP